MLRQRSANVRMADGTRQYVTWYEDLGPSRASMHLGDLTWGARVQSPFRNLTRDEVPEALPPCPACACDMEAVIDKQARTISHFYCPPCDVRATGEALAGLREDLAA